MRLGHWGQASKVLEYAIHIHVHVCRWIFHLNYNYLFPTFNAFSAIFHRMSLLLGVFWVFFIVLICFWLTKFLPCKYILIFKKFWGALMDLKNKIRLHTVDIFTCTSMHIIKSFVNFHDLGPFVRSLKNTRFLEKKPPTSSCRVGTSRIVCFIFPFSSRLISFKHALKMPLASLNSWWIFKWTDFRNDICCGAENTLRFRKHI